MFLVIINGDNRVKSNSFSLSFPLPPPYTQGCRGYGEAMPLPGFHSETIKDVEDQLHSLLPHFTNSTIPISCLKLDGSLTAWIDTTLKNKELYPSVRLGIEMAILHVASKVLKTPLAMLYGHHLELSQSSYVRLNGLMDRKKSVSVGGGGVNSNSSNNNQYKHVGGSSSSNSNSNQHHVVKVKVGGRSVKEDVTMVNELVESLRAGRADPPTAVLRLDANQAWTYEEVGGIFLNM